MLDPESREIKTPQIVDEIPNFVWQIEFPIGTIFCIAAVSALDAAEKLKSTGIEPFMIRRAGILLPMEGIS